MKNAFQYETDIGTLTLIDDGEALTDVIFGSHVPDGVPENETPLLYEAARQLRQYLAGERIEFELPLAPQGTPFQMDVWKALQAIPYGETRSYAQIAGQVGSSKACRAVGLANNRNPIAIIIPCHRVVGSNGSLVGYGGGLELKLRLIRMEKVKIGEALPFPI